MKAIYGLYDDPDIAQRAFDGLRRAGAADADIVVISSEPFEEHGFSHRDRGAPLYLAAMCGGLAGLVGGYLLTSLSQRAWPIKTSGMPIVANWPNIIVIFELTMLGAILATVATLLVSARLFRHLPALYDTEVTQGYILVGVQAPALVSAPQVASALEAAGQGRVKTID
jgi:hypothetical protein